jgi:hypothetical protein
VRRRWAHGSRAVPRSQLSRPNSKPCGGRRPPGGPNRCAAPVLLPGGAPAFGALGAWIGLRCAVRTCGRGGGVDACDRRRQHRGAPRKHRPVWAGGGSAQRAPRAAPHHVPERLVVGVLRHGPLLRGVHGLRGGAGRAGLPRRGRGTGRADRARGPAAALPHPAPLVVQDRALQVLAARRHARRHATAPPPPPPRAPPGRARSLP